MNIGLVLEGGGMRGVFTAGVTDCFLDNKIFFPYVIGVSAGASNGLSYASRQRGRARKCDIEILSERNYIGLKYLITSGCIMDYDFLFDELPKKRLPYDMQAYLKSGRYVMVATSCAGDKLRNRKARLFRYPHRFRRFAFKMQGIVQPSVRLQDCHSRGRSDARRRDFGSASGRARKRGRICQAGSCIDAESWIQKKRKIFPRSALYLSKIS